MSKYTGIVIIDNDKVTEVNQIMKSMDLFGRNEGISIPDAYQFSFTRKPGMSIKQLEELNKLAWEKAGCTVHYLKIKKEKNT